MGDRVFKLVRQDPSLIHRWRNLNLPIDVIALQMSWQAPLSIGLSGSRAWLPGLCGAPFDRGVWRLGIRQAKRCATS